jgi:sorbitol-specific phosphotransferase system component IIC
MSTTLKKEQAYLQEEAGKLKKAFEAIKKFFSKEFLWVLGVFLLALPLALTLTYLVENYTSKSFQNAILTNLKGNSLFYGAYLFSIAGIYLSRMVSGAIYNLTNTPKA